MRRSSADQLARWTPVHPVASTGRSTPLASTRCAETTFPLSTVVKSAASPDADGVMHTIGPLAGARAIADSPGGVAVQQPIQPIHLGPTRACCAPATVAAPASMPSTATQRFFVTFIGNVLMDEA